MSEISAKRVVVDGAFDDLRASTVRFLHRASEIGALHVLLWTDAAVQARTGKPPKFPFSERKYLLEALRFVAGVTPVEHPEEVAMLTTLPFRPDVWVCSGNDASSCADFPARNQIESVVLGADSTLDFPALAPQQCTGRKKVIVTGCYDWFHSGHVRFFEEVSALGDLFVVVGHDANIRLLKGAGHPLFPQTERRYLVSCVRYVTEALVSTGQGWVDADPEILRIKPDIYAVNEDGDRGGKREYCEKLGIEYVVLKRTPAPGLPQRSSTDLRGF